jgi:predicted ATPase
MRIAFSGSHRVGKTSLIEEVARRLNGYETVEEPYNQLEEDGYEHAEEPTLQDFQAQLEKSIESLEDAGRNVLYDRCPADVLAYLLTHEEADAFDPDEWMERAREAMESLDFVVFVPIEQPDRIAVPSHEDLRFRRRVHKKLENLLLDDAYDFGTEVLVVEGDLQARCEQVLARVRVA